MEGISKDIDFLERIVQFDTNSDLKSNYIDCAEAVKNEAESNGLAAETHDSVKMAKDEKARPNVVVRLDAGASETIVVATHYDVVAAGCGWRHNPFKLTVEGEKAFGRGAADDKGAIACAMGALRELARAKPKANVVLLVSPEEEVGGELGLGYLVGNKGIRGDAGIILDSSPSMISIGASGLLWGKITVKGRQGHAGYPHLAKNAIDEATPLLSRLCAYSKARARIRSKISAPPNSPHKQIWGRFSLTMLSAGMKENIIPGECEVRFDLRVCPDENYDKAKRHLRAYFDRVSLSDGIDATMEYTLQSASNYFTDPKHPFVRQFREAAERAFGRKMPVAGELGGNDGHYLSRVGMPVVCFGPLRDECHFHGTDEFVYLKDIKMVKETLFNLVVNWNVKET